MKVISLRDRDRAVATLTRWEARTVLSTLRKSSARRKQQRSGSILVAAKTTAGETTPLLSSGSSFTYTQGQNGNRELEYSYV
jgi:hypothetical protein